jgi:uncharacterized protein (TIGR02145 family)
MKNRICLYSTIITAVFLVFASGCKKDEVKPVYQTNGKTTAIFNSNLTYGTMTDQEGNIYKTITIGAQTWMAENLRATIYRNGDSIKNVVENLLWMNLSTGAYCRSALKNDVISIATHGLLYNYYAVVDERNIAPLGWHVPIDEEWTTLITSIGGTSIAGGKMKELGTTHWLNENIGATNESGFTALPCSYRDNYDGIVKLSDRNVVYWSSSEDDNSFAWIRYLQNDLSRIGRSSWSLGGKKSGYSVRCIKDL